jgi:dephospho-CoA kinase
MILGAKDELQNPNSLILGMPGSGKSFAAKYEIALAFLRTVCDIIICDPEAEYWRLVEALKGQVIRLSATSTIT